jgi:aminopeptidase N
MVAPYPGKTLRMIATPELGFSGYALPQTVLISHRLGFRAKPTPTAEFSQVYRRAVHETAHQWFGHLLGYGIAEERAFLIESLAKYAELVMIEQRYGKNAMQSLVQFERDRYARARLIPAEESLPLIDAEDSEDMYSRATLAFACLRERLGDELILASLHQLASQSRGTGKAASSVEFVSILNAMSGSKRFAPIKSLLTESQTVDRALRTAGCHF